MPELNEYTVEVTYRFEVVASNMRQAQEEVLGRIRSNTSTEGCTLPRVRSVIVSDIHVHAE